ncbi:MAG: MATE family efflux transporter [Thiohalomonadales bacterium]
MTHNIHQQIGRIAVPMILANISVPLLGIVDTAVVGHLDSPHYIGAVSVGASIFGIVFWGFGFLRMSTTGLTAQALGADDNNEIRAILLRATLVALVIALLLIGLQWFISSIAFRLIHATPLVESHALNYFTIRIYSAPATLINYAILGWFLGMQNARFPLLLVLVANLINMILDYILVVHYGFGTGGVAFASVVAEYVQLGLGAGLLKYTLNRHPGQWHLHDVLDRVQIRRTLAINVDIFIRTLCLMFALAYLVARGAVFGDIILAANAILVNFQLMMAHGLDGFAHSAEALVGRAVGRRDKRLLVKTVQANMQWAFLGSLLFSLVYLLLGEQIIALMTGLPGVKDTAKEYLPWLIILPIICVWAFVLDGAFIGALWAKSMRNIMLVATFLVFVPASYLFSAWANHGLWLAFVLFMLTRSMLMGWEYRRNTHRQDKLWAGSEAH